MSYHKITNVKLCILEPQASLYVPVWSGFGAGQRSLAEFGNLNVTRAGQCQSSVSEQAISRSAQLITLSEGFSL